MRNGAFLRYPFPARAAICAPRVRCPGVTNALRRGWSEPSLGRKIGRYSAHGCGFPRGSIVSATLGRGFYCSGSVSSELGSGFPATGSGFLPPVLGFPAAVLGSFIEVLGFLIPVIVSLEEIIGF